jgi:hypothetical protein
VLINRKQKSVQRNNADARWITNKLLCNTKEWSRSYTEKGGELMVLEVRSFLEVAHMTRSEGYSAPRI